jgi:large subunit ribosomal protein L3
MTEMAIAGTKEQKLDFIKDKLNKTITVSEIFPSGVVDIRGISIGRGLQGPVKRFGIGLKNHKSEKELEDWKLGPMASCESYIQNITSRANRIFYKSCL